MAPRRLFAYVDGLRGIAVLSIVAFNGFLPEWQTVPPRISCLARGFELFFVISGFCLAYPFLSRLREGRGFALDPSIYAGFLVRRFSRIAPPFYVALAFFALLGFTSFGFPTSAAPHGPAFWPHVTREFFLDLAFLTPPAPIHNAAFWTLGVQARWYLVCPLLIALYVRARWAFFAVAMALYGVYYFTLYGSVEVGTLPCFMAGIVAADVVLRRQAWRRFAWIGAAATLALGIWAAGYRVDHGDPVWHAACFFLVVAGSTPIVARVLTWRPLVAIGIASYSIYLYHAPLEVWFERQGVAPPLAAAWAVAVGFVAWALVERVVASHGFRRALEARIAARFRRRPRPEPSRAEAV